MKKLFLAAREIGLRGFLIRPTENVTIQVFRALIVGGIAFIADAGPMWLLTVAGLHYLISGSIGFLLAVTVNYLLSIRFVFFQKASMGPGGEFSVYIAISLVGLLLTMLLLWFFTEIAGLFFMVSKVIATIVVFGWNFTARKLILYRKK